MGNVKAGHWVVLILVLILGYSSVYVVTEGQQALVLWLGKISLDSKTKLPAIKQPGIHFKVPFFNEVKIFDTRLQTLDIKSSRIVTAEKKDVIVDYYAKWRIQDLALYFTRTGGKEQQTQILLEQQLNDGLRAEFGRRTIKDVISDDRAAIMDTLRNQANSTAKRLGLIVVDVRIKRIDLPPEVSSAIFDRMRAERERVATEHRAQGRARAEAIRANADANATVTVAQAKSDAARIRGEGDATAAQVYADAYNKDPNFYSFYRSLHAYKSIFSTKDDILVIKPDSQFFKYFKNNSVASK